MTTPETTQPPTEESASREIESKWGINEEASIIASGLALVLVNAHFGYPEVKEVTMPWFGTEERVVRTLSVEEQQHLKQTATSREVAAEKRVASVEVGLEKWAEFFKSDPDAGELLDPGFTDEVVDQIKELINGGSTINSIFVAGHSSAEDDNVDETGRRTAGLDTANKKNVDLAVWRSSVFAVALETGLREKGIETPLVATTSGVEDFLEQEEIAELEGLVEQFGYTATRSSSPLTHMIERYNRAPDDVPPIVRETLDRMLRQERFVEVTIRHTLAAGAPEVRKSNLLVTETTAKINEVPVESPRDIIVKIPLFIPIFVLIPEKRWQFKDLDPQPKDKTPTGVPQKKEKPMGFLSPKRKEKDELFKHNSPLNGHKQGYNGHVRHLRVQPREHNAHQRRTSEGGKMPRNKGGSRSGKRVGRI